MIPVGVGLSSNIDDKARADSLRQRNLFRSPFSFGEMKRRIEMRSHMFRSAIVIGGIPVALRGSSLVNSLQLKALGRRPVERLVREWIGHVDEFPVVDPVGCKGAKDKKGPNRYERSHRTSSCLLSCAKRTWSGYCFFRISSSCFFASTKSGLILSAVRNSASASA